MIYDPLTTYHDDTLGTVEADYPLAYLPARDADSAHRENEEKAA